MIECVDFRAVERGSLRGFAKVGVPQWHLTIDDVAIHDSNGKRWAALPARPQLNANREVVRGDDGKPKYVKTLFFDSREIADRFSSAVLEAVDKHQGNSKKPVADVLNDELPDFTL